jgi:DNA-binding beta-propeller fold protein YncE
LRQTYRRPGTLAHTPLKGGISAMPFWKNRWARVADGRVLLVRPRAGRRREATRALAATFLVVSVLAGAAATASAGQPGSLTLEGCVATSSTAVGCVNVPGGTDTNPVGVAVSPDGRSVYVAAGDRIEHFFAAAKGALTYDGCVSDDGSGGACADIPGTANPLVGVIAVAVSPDGRSVYVASTGNRNPEDATVSHFFAAAQGQLTWDGCVSDSGLAGACAALPSVALLGLDGIAVSPSGAVYAVSSEAVSHFYAAPQGQLTWDGCVGYMAAGCTAVPSSAFADPNGIAVSANAKSVYVTSGAGAVSHFFVAPQGQLSWDGCVSDDGTGGSCADVPGTATPLAQADAVAVSADGKSVDVTSSDGVVSHLFAAPQGQISWDGCVSDDGSGGSCADIPGSGSPMAGADSVALSTDGRSAYVGAYHSSAVSVFSVAAQGQLAYQSCVSDAGGNGCADAPGSPMGGALDIALSNDGSSLYVASLDSGSVAHFRTSGATAPVLSSLAIRPSAFAAAPGGPTVVITPSSRLGGNVTYQLSATASVRFVVSRAVAGRLQHVNGVKRCVPLTPRNVHAGTCVRIITVGSFTRPGVAGANSFRFSGRINGARLPVGSGYALTATPAGGKPDKATFRIKPA